MGHANSTRRIAAEDWVRPPTPPRARPIAPVPVPVAVAAPPSPPSTPPPTPSPAPAALTTYTLPFTANLIRTDSTAPSEKLQLRGRRELEDANWGEYLAATMRDAVCDRYSTHIGEDMPMEDWEVTLSDSVTQEQDPKGFFYTVYSGTLTWTSVSCDLQRVQEEIDWRIGDRMCMYEINYDNWHVYIHPKKVATVPVA
jgi:hypothetical protein